MGVIDDIFDALLGEGSSKVSSDPKETQVTESENSVSVRNSDVIIDHSTGSHSTMWSKTEVEKETGKVTIQEGGHGENYHPK